MHVNLLNGERESFSEDDIRMKRQGLPKLALGGAETQKLQEAPFWDPKLVQNLFPPADHSQARVCDPSTQHWKYSICPLQMMVENPSLPAQEQATQHLSLLLEQGEDSLKRKEDKKKKNPHPVPLTKQPSRTKGRLLFHSPEG